MAQAAFLQQAILAAVLAAPIPGSADEKRPARSPSPGHEAAEAWHLGPDAVSEAGEVLAYLHRLDDLVFEAGNLAELSAGPSVKRFAREVAATHQEIETRVAALAAQLRERPEVAADELSRASGMPPPARRLRGVAGAAFDSAYLELIVSESQRVIRFLEEEQRENTQEERTLRLVSDVVPGLRARSDAAQALRRALVARGTSTR